MSSPNPCSPPLDIQWTRPPLVRRPYITWGPAWPAVSPIEESASFRARNGDEMSRTLSPTPYLTLGTELSLAVTPKSIVPLPSSTAYTPSPSICQQCDRVETPYQFFCRWYGVPPCKITPSGYPNPPGDGPARARQEVHIWRKIKPPATVPPAQIRLVPLTPPLPE